MPADNPNTPLKRQTRPPAQGYKAAKEHKISASEIQATCMTHYMDKHITPLVDAQSYADKRKLNLLKAILADATVNAVHKKLTLLFKNDELESAAYGTTSKLLNCISVAYYKHALCDGPAIVFASHPGELLLEACEIDFYSSNQPWSVLVDVGEIKRPNNPESADGQLKSYMAGLKRYRPDLPLVHGFSLEKNRIRLASLNACGMSESQSINWEELLPWVVHVVQVYTAVRTPRVDIQYCAAQLDFYRWDIRKANVDLAVSPFYVGHPPGRTTFACFEIGRLRKDDPCTDAETLASFNEQFRSGVAKGFWKMSWQRVTSRSSERKLLTDLHKDGWVPGLVRHYPESSLRDEDSTAILHPSDEGGIRRVMDVLHLGSIGQPLSQCETAEELLDVMYDTLEIHAHLCKRGVLHRDISWFNVMCRPQHYITEHPNADVKGELDRPCIKRIFGEADGKPCALLCDLDHAVYFTDLHTRETEKTGTAMFTSVHIEAPKASRLYAHQPLAKLLQEFRKAEEDKDLFDRAFPEGGGNFIANFQRVKEAEAERDYEEGLQSDQRHDWRHDAESVYWVFLWAFTRARPVHSNSPETDKFRKFCEAMLKEPSRQETTPCVRDTYLTYGEINTLFDPQLFAFESLLFRRMAMYLSVPWHLYSHIMGPDHVHVAFRRLIIAFKRERDNAKVLSVRLDTEHPRVTTALEDNVRLASMKTDKRAIVGLSQSIVPAGTRSASSRKRKAEVEAARIRSNAPAAKKSKLATGGESSDSDLTDDPDALSAADFFAKVLAPAMVVSKQVAANNGVDGTPPAEPMDEDRSTTAVDDQDSDSGLSDDPDPAGTAALLAMLARSKPTMAVDDVFADGSSHEIAEPEPLAEEERKDKKSVDEEVYIASEHCHAQSANALRLMFWKDRALWFGSGK